MPTIRGKAYEWREFAYLEVVAIEIIKSAYEKKIRTYQEIYPSLRIYLLEYTQPTINAVSTPPITLEIRTRRTNIPKYRPRFRTALRHPKSETIPIKM
jgi:hypothetical protein